MIPFSKRDEEPEEQPDRPHWFRADLSGPMRDRMLGVMRKQAADPTNTAILEALELAERIDSTYTPPVDWDKYERWAQRGYSLVDQLADGFKPKADPEGEKS